MAAMRVNVNGHEPLRIDSGIPRSRTEPSSALMRLVLTRTHPEDDQPEVDLYPPTRKRTQKDQDEADERARKRAQKDLVNSWQERLQLISVITTFFASIETGLLAMTTPTRDNDGAGNLVLRGSNAVLVGALVVHVYSAILSFLAAFLLINYKLEEATKEELKVEGIEVITASPVPGSITSKDMERDIEKGGESPEVIDDSDDRKHGSHKKAPKRRDTSPEPPILSKNPHIEQVGLFRRAASSHLLSRFHTLCISLAAIGFVLCITGIILYAWALHPLSVSIFGTTCLGGSMVAGLWIVFV
ncbi:hypothetical protein SERLA73DRAFT_191900 [Serpula lacrymans var. lacrymans S7.3]|uniref:Uncharacterized protein n=2 Tax=Serpula lacrymans var. lacrymans TaxID=341189 RepID=F8QIJ9_SERL3|nr:uncharacterized protein SERLADRAFT_463176 [Serpula lacrymans var. lacrymans S7.9]EGN91881.1 hypothetical protein SERLA73DRAFT_191900 [Serpula lacrymans var. lacrymans S7.3]EGO26283.1 hypothetical protein SERLADRAFT_463176 [Serpula lacrymans var. lacrymans S7.9]